MSLYYWSCPGSSKYEFYLGLYERDLNFGRPHLPVLRWVLGPVSLTLRAVNYRHTVMSAFIAKEFSWGHALNPAMTITSTVPTFETRLLANCIDLQICMNHFCLYIQFAHSWLGTETLVLRAVRHDQVFSTPNLSPKISQRSEFSGKNHLGERRFQVSSHYFHYFLFPVW